MLNIFKFFVLCSLTVLALSSSYFHRVVLPANGDAKCLDGSPGVYHISMGKGINRNKFVLFFEQGGWCGSDTYENTLESCYQRTLSDKGSSKNDNSITKISLGIMSGEKNQNPGFYDWTRVYFRYCDGTGHQGTRSQPIQYKGTKLFFRGHNITVDSLASLDRSYKLFSDATHILVTGYSAGGLAAFTWTNYIAKKAKGIVWCAPDSGIFLDSMNVKTNKFDYRQQFINFMNITNTEIDPPAEECVVANNDKKWKCMFAEELQKYISVPLFALNALYDSWSISNIVGIDCITYDGSLKYCNLSERQILQSYRQNVTDILNSITSRSANGAWAPSCAHHGFMHQNSWVTQRFRVPAHSEYSSEFSVRSWILDHSDVIKNTHIEKDPWPINDVCAGGI